MIARHEDESIKEIWSSETEKSLMRSAWLIHRATYGPKKKRKPLKKKYPEEKHEVVKSLVEVCLEFGDGDLHWGLTSSDIVDYVRITQVEKSCVVVDEELEWLRSVILQKLILWDAVECVGYTHLLPAARTTMGARFRPLFNQLIKLQVNPPGVVYKPFAGPVGRHKVESLVFKNKSIQLDCNQTTDGFTYFEVACWLASISRVVHKFAYDLRLLVSMGELAPCSEVGSSSMTHKDNPTQLERVCSLAIRQPQFVLDVWHATAHSALERTLTDSACLRNTLPEMFHNVVRQLIDLRDGLDRVTLNEGTIRERLSRFKDELDSYDELIQASASRPRLDAYYDARRKKG